MAGIATITAGAVNNSTSLTILATGVSNGSVIVVTRGEMIIGTGTVSSGAANVTVMTLATGDIIQASVGSRGNQAGIPVLVQPATTLPTGWLDPTTITITNPDGTTSVYDALSIDFYFGETIPALYDPIRAGKTKIPAEYIPVIRELGFDTEQNMQAGTTTIRVIPRGTEGLLVGWNGATPTSPAPLTVTTSATVTVTVIRDDNPTVTLTRSIAVTVLPAPTSPSTPAAGDIGSAAYRNMGGGFIRIMINSRKPCEAQLFGYSSTWKPGTNRDPDYIEVDNYPVPSGTYTAKCRVVGETNPANYFTFTIVV